MVAGSGIEPDEHGGQFPYGLPSAVRRAISRETEPRLILSTRSLAFGMILASDFWRRVYSH